MSDSDSEEEIRRLVAAEQTSHDALQQEVQDDSLEVVGVDFLVKPKPEGNRSGFLKRASLRPNAKFFFVVSDDEEEEDYDSADTDELFSSRKQPAEKLPAGTVVPPDSREEERKRGEEGRPSSSQQRGGDEEEAESSSSSADSDYEAMFSDVARLEICLDDLQKLAETAAGSAPNPDAHASCSPAERAAPKEGITPEEILASLLKGHKDDEERPKRKRRGVTLPAFMGTKSLMAASGGGEEEGGGGAKKQKLNPEEEEESSPNRAAAEDQPSSSSCSEEEEQQVSLAPPSEEEKEDQAPPRVALGAEEEEELQRKANMRRLAALQQRQKEAEEHRKLIQGALSNLVGEGLLFCKHFLFQNTSCLSPGVRCFQM